MTEGHFLDPASLPFVRQASRSSGKLENARQALHRPATPREPTWPEVRERTDKAPLPIGISIYTGKAVTEYEVMPQHRGYWLKEDVLLRVDTHPASRIDELLPHRWKPPPAQTPV